MKGIHYTKFSVNNIQTNLKIF